MAGHRAIGCFGGALADHDLGQNEVYAAGAPWGQKWLVEPQQRPWENFRLNAAYAGREQESSLRNERDFIARQHSGRKWYWRREGAKALSKLAQHFDVPPSRIKQW